MNEKNSITELEDSIKSHVGHGIAVLYLFICICFLIAPIFSPYIKHMKRKQYIMHKNFEELAEADMKGIRIFLWGISILGWVVLTIIHD